jgi:asparagine synthase (glutamine-hydrolysing)
MQEWTWRGIDGPSLCWTVEEWQHDAARRGFEFRFPFLDPRLAEFVLTLPPELRQPGGRMKRLLRDGLAEVLPMKIARRGHVTGFDPVLRLHLQRSLPLFRTLICDDPEWLSERYVPRDRVRNQILSLDSENPGRLWLHDLIALANIASLEWWLRGLRSFPVLKSPPRSSP